MPSLWTFDDFEAHEPSRAHELRSAPTWRELVEATRGALRAAVAAQSARFALDESRRDSRHLRGVVQFPLGRPLFDQLFNSTTGYRAQFRIGRTNGLEMNAQLIRTIVDELRPLADAFIVIHRLKFDFTYKDSAPGKISRVTSTLDPQLSKVWACEKLIGKSGQIQELFVSRTGPKLVFPDTDSWSSLSPEDENGWLDVKGAFLGPTGAYQPKPPEERAEMLEERGTA